jgi:Asp-tRNA(Asn)/Glu-tRNA(Gln) amidotransferase B subunit
LLMGAAMKEVRGKANPDLVGKLLRQRLPWFFILVFDIFV